MQSNKQMRLEQQTILRYMALLCRRGAAGIVSDHKCRKRYLFLVLGITVVIALIRPHFEMLAVQLLYDTLYGLIWVVACFASIPACGYIPGSWRMYDDLTRAGIVNYAGEAPLLIDRQRLQHSIEVLTFQITGYPYENWDENRTAIESALNVCILSLQQGKDNQTFALQVVPGNNAFQDTVLWQDDFLSENPAVLVLGVNAAGIPVSIDFKKIPHWLLAAATGYGKTQLLLLMLHQLYMHDWIIYLADYKSVDYPAEYQTDGHYATDNVQLLSMLDTVSAELIRRRHLLSASGCNHLDVYNSRHNDKLRRIVVVLDETSMILDATGRDKNEKSEIAAITGHLLTIGRLGRAMGIHLIIATQRPDVASVPGALKAQLDGRLCGHASDVQSAIVILDDGSGAKLPAIPGRFIVRDGTGDDKIIQAYLYQTNQNQNTGKE